MQSGTIMSRVFYRDSDFISKNCKKLCQKREARKSVGSTKFESMGVCFLKRVETEDPSALMGLPLIELQFS